MAQSSESVPIGDVVASPQAAVEQQAAADWPKPGEEGYVHPDGTPQSRKQLQDNLQAAADRAAAGSTVHGAPMATPGPTPEKEAAKAEKAAEDYSGPTPAEARQGQTEFIRDGLEAKTEEANRELDSDTAASNRARSSAVAEPAAAKSKADNTRTTDAAKGATSTR